MDRGVWQATVHGVTRSGTCLSMHAQVLRYGFPGGSVVKNLPANAGGPGLISRSGRSPGEGNGNPLHYSCLENPMDRGVWQATAHGVTKSQTQLSKSALL